MGLNSLLTLFQSLQLMALGPCLFIIVFLLLVTHNVRQTTIPICYFLSLSASFLLPLLPLFTPSPSLWLHGALLLAEGMMPALSFLLILQCVYNKPPPIFTWLILALPVFGGSPFIYGRLMQETICLGEKACLAAENLGHLYHIIGSGFIFLLLLFYFARRQQHLSGDTITKRHKYWLVIALIGLNIALTGVNLFGLANLLATEEALLIQSTIRIGFIYLVLTSLFRVFGDVVAMDAKRVPTFIKIKEKATSRKHANDDWMIARIRKAMEEDKCYQRACLSRETLAEQLAIPEHQLSRVINAHFNRSFIEYTNHFRVEEAKDRLRQEDTAITTIAYDVGFNSVASFNRVFKTQVGMTPTAYRKHA